MSDEADRLIASTAPADLGRTVSVQPVLVQQRVVEKLAQLERRQDVFVVFNNSPVSFAHMLRRGERLDLVEVYIQLLSIAEIAPLFSTPDVQSAVVTAIRETTNVEKLLNQLIKSKDRVAFDKRDEWMRTIFTREVIDALLASDRYLQPLSVLLGDRLLEKREQGALYAMVLEKVRAKDYSVLPIVNAIGRSVFSIRESFFTEELIKALLTMTGPSDSEQNRLIESALKEIRLDFLESAVDTTSISAAWMVYPQEALRALAKRADLRNALLAVRTVFSLVESVPLLSCHDVGVQDAFLAWLATPGNDIKNDMLKSLQMPPFLQRLLIRDESAGHPISDEAIIAVLNKYPSDFFRHATHDAIFDAVQRRLETASLSDGHRSGYLKWCNAWSKPVVGSHK